MTRYLEGIDSMKPIMIIARQLADLPPYRDDPDARAELIAAAERHEEEFAALKRRVFDLEERMNDHD